MKTHSFFMFLFKSRWLISFIRENWTLYLLHQVEIQPTHHIFTRKSPDCCAKIQKSFKKKVK